MPRLRQVPRAEVTSEIVITTYDLLFGDRDPVAEPGTVDRHVAATGGRSSPCSPDVLEHCNRGFALYRNPARKLDPVLRELGQTRVGWAKASQFVFSQHCKSLRGLKVSEEKIAAIPHWQVATCYSTRGARGPGLCRLPGAAGRPHAGARCSTALKAFLSDEEILELTYIVCLYDMHAVMSRALRLECDDRDDPIVEVAAPEGFSARDFLDTGRRPA